jgi:alcohol dehydrogenase class IV
MMNAFSLAATPHLYFGPGKSSLLFSLIKQFGTRAILVRGGRPLEGFVEGQKILAGLSAANLTVEQISVGREPTPAMIDHAVEKLASFRAQVVVAIGGGSVLDAGKAISAMLPLNEPVKNYLEGIGTMSHPGTKIPFIALPTTAGTGSESTKNAVVSETGPEGYKRSLRHNNFVPDIAIVDPQLTVTCPPSVTAASGMDAFTQLLESYLSTSANPVTDALAIDGLRRISKSLLKAYHDGSDLASRTDMAYAAYLSGVTLANAGLGLVHGFASSVGGFIEIPHGVICSSVMFPTNQLTINKLRSGKENSESLIKYATVGKVFATKSKQTDDYYIDFLLDLINSCAVEMKIPRLKDFGLKMESLHKIVGATENKNNPARLTPEEMREALEMAL